MSEHMDETMPAERASDGFLEMLAREAEQDPGKRALIMNAALEGIVRELLAARAILRDVAEQVKRGQLYDLTETRKLWQCPLCFGKHELPEQIIHSQGCPLRRAVELLGQDGGERKDASR